MFPCNIYSLEDEFIENSIVFYCFKLVDVIGDKKYEDITIYNFLKIDKFETSHSYQLFVKV